MQFYTERIRQQQILEAEERGEDVWVEDIPTPAAVKIGLTWADIIFEPHPNAGKVWAAAEPEVIDDIALRQTGRSLALGQPDDMEGLERDDLFFVIEAVHHGLVEAAVKNYAARFADNVIEILRSYRVKFQFVAATSQMVPLESFEMHAAVVEPTLSLLHGRPDLAGALRSYEDALKEISQGKPADAITDAGTALQQVLESLGCEGNVLGQLIQSAKKKGIIGGHDGRLTDSIESALYWAAANRNERGDTHKLGSQAIEDAWLMVHLVGALIVRLTADTGEELD